MEIFIKKGDENNVRYTCLMPLEFFIFSLFIFLSVITIP